MTCVVVKCEAVGTCQRARACEGAAWNRTAACRDAGHWGWRVYASADGDDEHEGAEEVGAGVDVVKAAHANAAVVRA